MQLDAPSLYNSVLCCTASRVVALASASSDAALMEADYELINKLLAWPAAALFPALDLARLLALDAVASQRLAASAGSQAVGAEHGEHLIAQHFVADDVSCAGSVTRQACVQQGNC